MRYMLSLLFGFFLAIPLLLAQPVAAGGPVAPDKAIVAVVGEAIPAKADAIEEAPRICGEGWDPKSFTSNSAPCSVAVLEVGHATIAGSTA